MEKGAGQLLIDELRRRGLYGSFFDYDGYQKLRSVDSDDELRQFLIDQGIGNVADVSNPESLTYEIAKRQTAAQLSSPSFWDPTGCLFLITLPVMAVKVVRDLIEACRKRY